MAPDSDGASQLWAKLPTDVGVPQPDFAVD
jgi:hypothetical protein